eukprot:jgi/Picsp_1/3743/NSC_06579-R1_---NA---
MGDLVGCLKFSGPVHGSIQVIIEMTLIEVKGHLDHGQPQMALQTLVDLLVYMKRHGDVQTVMKRLYESCGVYDADMLDSSTSGQATAVAEHQSDQPVLEQPRQVGAGYSTSIFTMLQQLENLSISNNGTNIDPFSLARHEGEDMAMARAEDHAVLFATNNSAAYYCSNGLLSRHTEEQHNDSSFMCDKCGCIISLARMEQHYLYWCESLS